MKRLVIAAVLLIAACGGEPSIERRLADSIGAAGCEDATTYDIAGNYTCFFGDDIDTGRPRCYTLTPLNPEPDEEFRPRLIYESRCG